MDKSTWKDAREIEAKIILSGSISEEDLTAEMEQLKHRQRAYRLAEMRKASSLRQADVAKMMKVSQRRVSAIEHGEISKTELGTLQSYVEALGGQIEVVANFGDERLIVG